MTHTHQRYWNFLWQYLTPLRGKVFLLAGLIVATIGLQLLNPQIIRYFIDTALATNADAVLPVRSLLLAAATFFLATLLLQGATVAATYVGEDVGWRATNQLRNDLTRHALHLDMSFHNSHTPGEMIERLDGDVAEIAIFFAQFVLRVLGNLLLLVGVLIVLAWIDWRMSATLALYALICLYCLAVGRRWTTPFWEVTRQRAADLFSFFAEYLAGTEDLRSSGAVGYTLRKLFQLSKARLTSEVQGGNREWLFLSMWDLFYLIGQVIAFSFSYWLFTNGSITLGTVYLMIWYNDRLLRPLDEITTQLQHVQKALAGIHRVFALADTPSKIQDQGSATLRAAPPAVTFDNVTFGYGEGEPVLQALSFQLPAGKVLGLLGRTGSGKTTLTRLLYRLYDPTSGRICLNTNDEAVDIRQLGLRDLRGRIGMVTQDVQLFQASVRDNLTFFDPTISDERIHAVIEMLELGEWLRRLPNGLDSELQSEGNSLSAGEAQLLAFLRVFLHKPELVILDEATSRLDPATERLLERAVDKLLAGTDGPRTAIIIAHRLATIQRADQLLILHDGCIQEQGDRQQLANDPTSRFYALLQTGLTEVLA
ncbi:MAG: ABC transporter ATP-binding protein [Caldilineaceae bacterium]|nr:ABC transporter ATP-binding protein [Caldilineaceae bacterium]